MIFEHSLSNALRFRLRQKAIRGRCYLCLFFDEGIYLGFFRWWNFFNHCDDLSRTHLSPI